MPSRVTHLTKIVDVKEVEFHGELDFDFEGWTVEGEAIEEWLEKFRGKRVRITIVNLDHPDDSHMLENTTMETKVK